MLLPCLAACAGGKQVIHIGLNGNLADALESIADNGTIYIEGRYNILKEFIWENHGKTVTITGGTLSFTQHKNFSLGDNVRFEKIQLQFAEDSNLYANGFDLYVSEDVKVSGKVTLYGGARLSDVARTNLTLLGGKFYNVCGGGHNGDVLGDVNMTIGGNFNKGLSISHAHDHQVFGGGNDCTVNGNVNLTFSGNAKANYVYGGGCGKRGEIKGHINLRFNDGNAMSVCGGGKDVNPNCDVYLFFNGGQVEQIFGGCEKASMSGNVLVQVTAGKVTRRIYGGCYNNYTMDGWQKTPNYVHGKILLLLGEDANITLNSGGGDNTLFAHSRQENQPKYESAHIAYTSIAAQSKHKSKLGPQDGTMKSILGNAKHSDGQHILTFSISGNTITQSCNKHDTASAKVSVSGGLYSGDPVHNTSVELSDSWLGPAPLIEYNNDLNVGIGSAVITMGNAQTTLYYVIWPRYGYALPWALLYLPAAALQQF